MHGHGRRNESSNTQNPDNHYDNHYDFMLATKLDKLIRYWKGNSEAADGLTRAEQDFLANTKMKKMLVNVVSASSTPLEESRKNQWIPLAIISIVAQIRPTARDFPKPRLAINPAKPGHSWVITPVKAAIFAILKNVRGALDPRSGTLVLFRPWIDASIPIQNVYAIGIHYKNDIVPFDVASMDYAQQMIAPLAANNIRILGMSPALFRDARIYCTEIKLGFLEGKTRSSLTRNASPAYSGPGKVTPRPHATSSTDGHRSAVSASQKDTSRLIDHGNT